jgi:hypothetical protein
MSRRGSICSECSVVICSWHRDRTVPDGCKTEDSDIWPGVKRIVSCPGFHRAPNRKTDFSAMLTPEQSDNFCNRTRVSTFLNDAVYEDAADVRGKGR